MWRVLPDEPSTDSRRRSAPAPSVAGWIPWNLGRIETIDAHHTRLVAPTDEPYWYCQHLVAIGAPFHILRPRQLREASHILGQRLLQASSEAGHDDS